MLWFKKSAVLVSLGYVLISTEEEMEPYTSRPFMITNTAMCVFLCINCPGLALWAHWPRSWQRPSKIGKVTFTGRDRHSTCCLFQEMQKFYCYVKSTLLPAKTHHYLIWTWAMHNCFALRATFAAPNASWVVKSLPNSEGMEVIKGRVLGREKWKMASLTLYTNPSSVQYWKETDQD